MISNHNQLATLRQRIRDTLVEGRSVAVIGWRDSNHNVFTRSIPSSRVVFLNSTPRVLGDTIGFVLFTRFVSHSVINRIKTRKEIHPIVLETGQIKDILESCQDLFIPDARCSMSVNILQMPVEPDTCIDNHEIHHGLLDFLTQPHKEIPRMNEIPKFVTAFRNAADLHPQKLVGSRTVGELRESSGVKKTNIQLVTLGWIEPVIGKDKKGNDKLKAGWYKAGRLMEVEGQKPETSLPETPTGRLAHLIAQKPTLIMGIEKLEAELTAKKAKLAMIDDAEAMLLKIDSAFLT